MSRPCNAYPCPNTIPLPTKDSYCPEHKKQYNRDRERYRRERDPVGRKMFYSTEWTAARDQKLERDPLCEWLDSDGDQCGLPAKYVQPIDSKGGTVDSNLRSLCPSHHAGDTRRGQEPRQGALGG